MIQPVVDNAAWRELFSRQYVPKLLTLVLAVWLHAANSMLAATTMPSAVEDIGGLHLISWAFALYLTGSITAGASISLLVNKWGLLKTMMYAAAVYVIGCTVCALAPSMPILLTGRTLQGLGGGGLLGLVYICQDRFFPNRFVPKVVACISLVWMVSAFAGPSIGGVFATLGLWRFAFWAFAAQGLLLIPAIGFLLRSAETSLSADDESLPIVRLLLLTAAILFVSISGAHFHSIASPVFIALGIASLGVFVARDRQASSGRMLPLAASNFSHAICNGMLTTFLLCLCIMSFLVYGPFLLIEIYGLTPFSAGVVVMLESLAWTAGAVTFSNAKPENEAHLIKIGSASVVIGLAAMAITVPYGPLWAIIVTAIIANGGFGMMWGFIIKRIVDESPDDDRDRASSLLPLTQQAGFAIGAALSGLIANGFSLSDSSSNEVIVTVAFWLFAGFVPIALLANMTAWRFVARFSKPSYAAATIKG